MILKLTALILIIFVTGLGGEIYLRNTNWADTNLIEGWGKLLSTRQEDAFTPNTKLQIVGQPFFTNPVGERYPLEPKSKTKSEVRIGLFGGANVVGVGLAEKNTLIHFMKINPASICELQGRSCTYYSYGRLNSSIESTASLIRKKIEQDNLDVIVWLADPFTNTSKSLPNLPLTSSLIVNWALNPITQKTLQSYFQSSGNFDISTGDQKSFDELRQMIFEKQKDMIPVVMPSMDLPLSPQMEWERKAASFFMGNGFLPLRGKMLFNENNRVKQQLYSTGLMDPEALRALASILKDRLNRAPHIRKNVSH